MFYWFPEVGCGSGRPYVNWYFVQRSRNSDTEWPGGELHLKPGDEELVLSAGTQCSRLCAVDDEIGKIYTGCVYESIIP